MIFYDIYYTESDSYGYDLTQPQLDALTINLVDYVVVATHPTTYQTIFQGSSLDNLKAWKPYAIEIGTRVHFRIVFSTLQQVLAYIQDVGGVSVLIEREIVPILNGAGITVHSPISDYIDGGNVDIYGTYTGDFTIKYSSLMVYEGDSLGGLLIKGLIAVIALAAVTLGGLSLYTWIKGDAEMAYLVEEGEQQIANNQMVQWLDENGYEDQVPGLFPYGTNPAAYADTEEAKSKTNWEQVAKYGMIGAGVIAAIIFLKPMLMKNGVKNK